MIPQRRNCHFPGRIRRQRALAVAVTLVLAACGGSGEGLDENGRPWSEHDWSAAAIDGTTSADALFNRIQDDILTPQCAASGCHSGTASPLGLDLSAGLAYDKLVGRDSVQVPGLQLVEASNADASYLLHKLQGTQTAGQRMPLYRQPIPDAQIAVVRQWILEGALPPSSSTDTTGGDAGGDGGNSTTDGTAGGSTPGTTTTLTDTFASIQAVVFDQDCAGCHSGAQPAGELDLSAQQSYASLVGRAATMDPQGKLLVAPGSATDSFLLDKLRDIDLGNSGEAGYRGERMPLFGARLDDTVLDTLERWITAGALDNQ